MDEIHSDRYRLVCAYPGTGRRSHDPLGVVAGEEEKVMGQMRRLTYINLMAVIRKIETKGYASQESERLARHIFAEFESKPRGMSIEERVRRVLTREEWERENREYGC